MIVRFWITIGFALSLAIFTLPTAAGNDTHKQMTDKESTMAAVTFGNNMKMSASQADRTRVEHFYRGVLGCEVTEKRDVDFIRFGNDFYLAIVYDGKGPGAANYKRATWLEIRTANPGDMQKRILAFGLKEIDHWDKEHFYFQAPGGQVFRLAPNNMINGWGLKK